MAIGPRISLIMARSYLAFDPNGVINGETLQAIGRAFHRPAHAYRLLQDQGLPTLPKSGVWYPLQSWLNLLGELEEVYGPQTVYAVGLQIATASVWPVGMATLEAVLLALDDTCRANIQSSPMGYYKSHPLGEHAMRVMCYTPTPVSFEHGLVTGVARQYKPAGSLRVRVEMEAVPPGSLPELKWFRVTWS